jgi:hypothetical protein
MLGKPLLESSTHQYFRAHILFNPSGFVGTFAYTPGKDSSPMRKAGSELIMFYRSKPQIYPWPHNIPRICHTCMDSRRFQRVSYSSRLMYQRRFVDRTL